MVWLNNLPGAELRTRQSRRFADNQTVEEAPARFPHHVARACVRSGDFHRNEDLVSTAIDQNKRGVGFFAVQRSF